MTRQAGVQVAEYGFLFLATDSQSNILDTSYWTLICDKIQILEPLEPPFEMLVSLSLSFVCML